MRERREKCLLWSPVLDRSYRFSVGNQRRSRGLEIKLEFGLFPFCGKTGHPLTDPFARSDFQIFFPGSLTRMHDSVKGHEKKSGDR